MRHSKNKNTDAANDEFGALSERIKNSQNGGYAYMSEQLRILIEGACEAKDKIIDNQAKELKNKELELQNQKDRIAALEAQIAAMQRTG